MFAQRLAFTRQTTRAFARRFATAGSQTQGQKSRRRLLAFSTLAAATAGTTYYMMQDIVYIEDAKDAHSKVPILALHPQVGGKKDLPIVSHALDNSEEENTKPRLVILGSGWGAVSVLKNLDVDKYNVTVISENNYFLFTPLLPCATVGTHELRSLLEPIRKIAARVRGHFLEARALEVDIENKMIEVQSVNGRQDRFYVPYDKLVVAVGATSITHGIEGIEHTMRLKTIQDAQQIRRKVLTNVELACLPTTTPEERKKLLSFVICGGGATGTEFAAELFDWMNEDLVNWFPKLLREDISVTIIQSRDHILNTFDVQISEYAEKRFEREGINIVTNARVARIDEDKVVYRLKNSDPDNPEFKEVPYGVCLWSTGIAMTPFVKNMSEKLGPQLHQRVLTTDGFLRVKGVDDGSIYALGDCATIGNPKILEHMMEIFENADEDQDGTLTLGEFNKAVKYMRRRFPLTERHLTKLENLFEKYDTDQSGTLDINEMRAMLKDIDSKMTHLPATAQVASQQGQYLGKYLSQIAGLDPESEEHKSRQVGTFTYNHLGTLAYLGNTAVGEFNWGFKMIGGLWAMYLWRSVYWSEQVSMRTRANLSIDWTKRAVFGRDISIV